MQANASLLMRVLPVRRVSGRERGYGKDVLDSGGRVSRSSGPSCTTGAGPIRRESLSLARRAHFGFPLSLPTTRHAAGAVFGKGKRQAHQKCFVEPADGMKMTGFRERVAPSVGIRGAR